MSIPTRNPLRMAGAVLSSGVVNTGENLNTGGGGLVGCIYSGILAGLGLTGSPGAVAAGPDALVFSGGGRLKDVLTHVGLISGQAVTFYDAAVATSGGPIFASGHKIIGRIAPNPPTGLSGATTLVGVTAFNMPFTSGLCIHMESGSPGVTYSWLPEVNSANPSA